MTFEKVELGTVCKFFNNLRKPVTRSIRVAGEYRYFGAAGIQDYVSEYLFDGDYILVGEDGTVITEDDRPVVQQVSGKFWVNNHAHVIQPNNMEDYDYFYYSISSTKIRDLVTGAVQPKLSMTNLKQLQIYWAEDSHRRRRIGSILRSLDAKIEVNNSLSKTLEDITQTIFKSWFINFDPVKAKMAGQSPVGIDEATAALFPDSMEESEIGMIPRSWELTSAGVFCPFKYGKALPASNRVFGEVPVYGSNGVVGTHNQALTSGPSIIVGRKGTVGTVNLELAPCWVIDTAFYVDTKELADIYLAYFQLQNLGLSEMNSDGAVPGLNRDNAQRLTFTVGNPALRKRFGEIAHYIFMQIANLKKENSSLTALRDSLLPRLISGELRIPDELLAS